MKYVVLAVIVICCYCNSPTSVVQGSSDFKKMEIKLIDSLGIVIANVPARYDTFFSWTHYSDCNTCHIQKYRVQTKNTSILKESGFYWDEPNDSVDRFTISHNQYLPFDVNDTTMILTRHSYFKNDLKFTRKGMRILADTIRKINDRYFSIFELEKSDSIIRRELLAISTIKGDFINFSFELIVNKRDARTRDFFVKSSNFINSIHLSIPPAKYIFE